MDPIEPKHVIVYAVLSGEYRAYVTNRPYQAWGYDKAHAINNLRKILAEADEAFDLPNNGYYREFEKG